MRSRGGPTAIEKQGRTHGVSSRPGCVPAKNKPGAGRGDLRSSKRSSALAPLLTVVVPSAPGSACLVPGLVSAYRYALVGAPPRLATLEPHTDGCGHAPTDGLEPRKPAGHQAHRAARRQNKGRGLPERSPEHRGLGPKKQEKHEKQEKQPRKPRRAATHPAKSGETRGVGRPF